MVHTNFNLLIKLGTKNIPIRLCSFVKTSYNKSPFTNTCPHCNSDVGRQDICKNVDCGKVIPSGEVLSAFVFSADERKVIDKELLKTIKKQVSKIEILGSRPKADTRVTIGGSYVLPREFNKDELAFVENEDDGFHAFKLLYSAVSGDKDIVVKYATSKSGREKLGILRPEGHAIALLDIPYQEVINELDEEVDVKVSNEEKFQAKKWIDSLKQVDVASIQDEYAQNVQKAIEGKLVTPKPTKSKNKSSFFDVGGKK